MHSENKVISCNAQLSISLLIGLLFAFSGHAHGDGECDLEGTWEVYDSYPVDDTLPAAIERGDKLFLAGNDKNNSAIVLEHNSAGGDMIPMCDSVDAESDNRVACYYDDKGISKYFEVELIGSPGTDIEDCRAQDPCMPEYGACDIYDCVIRWSNHRTRDDLPPGNPGDSDGTGGNDPP